jgi:TRAP-type C4-dicarboxylate transport system substrate-binding protein
MEPGEEDLYFHYRCAGGGPPYNDYSNSYQVFVEKLYEETKGHFKLDLYGTYAFGSWLDLPYLIGSGVIECGIWAPMYEPTEAPLQSIMWQPFAMPFHGIDRESIIEDNKDSVDLQIWLFTNTLGMQETIKNLNLYNWYPIHNYPSSGLCVSAKAPPIEKFEDFSGLSTRATGYHSVWAEHMGMHGVFVLCGEVYEALQKGMFEMTVGGVGSMISAATGTPYNYGEVCDRLILCGISGNNVGYAMNNDLWNALPDYIGELMDAPRSWLYDWTTDYYLNQNVDTLLMQYGRAEEEGIRVYWLPEEDHAKLRAAGKPAWIEFEKVASGVGSPITQALTEFKALWEELVGETWDQWGN